MKLSAKRAKELGFPVDPVTNRKTPRADRKAVKYVGDAVFDAMCEAHGLLRPTHEYLFARELGRSWRFDYLFDGWLALEVEGAVWSQGRHVRGQGFLDDIEKYNAAVLLGYSVIRCVPEDIQSGAACALVKEVLGSEYLQP